MTDRYALLIAFLEQHGARYRLIEHPPEGRTETVSALRGHAPAQAAKCIVLMVKFGRRQSRYVLAVVPGDRRIDFNAVKTLLGGTYVAFASPAAAEDLAGSVVGTVLPFAFGSKLDLIADPDLLVHEELFFNAARLDRSIALATADYLRLANPRVARIAAPPE